MASISHCHCESRGSSPPFPAPTNDSKCIIESAVIELYKGYGILIVFPRREKYEIFSLF